MIVAVTGGSGFIGRKLIDEHIQRGDDVRYLTRAKPLASISAKPYAGDIASPECSLKDFVNNADILYHCAAEIRDEARMQSVNVEGTRRLINAASGRIGRWVQLSSVGAYGPRASGVVTEHDQELPIGPYEATKTIADNLVREASAKSSFTSVLLRPSNVFGREMRNQSLFQMFSMIERGLFFFIGPPGASANYVHVDDVVQALALCGTHPAAKGRTFIVSDWCSIEALVAAIAGAMHSKVTRTRLPLLPVRLLVSLFGNIPKFPLTESRFRAMTTRVRYSSVLLERELGFTRKMPILDGMSDLAMFWKAAS